jgi:hypothetical protein
MTDKYIDSKGQIYMITDYGTKGKVWAAIRAESGEPIPEVGTHVDPEVAKQSLAEYAGKTGWMPYK